MLCLICQLARSSSPSKCKEFLCCESVWWQGWIAQLQPLESAKQLLSRNLITESSNMRDAKNDMRQSTNSLLEFDISFRIWFKGFFILFFKALCYTTPCQSQQQEQQSAFPHGLVWQNYLICLKMFRQNLTSLPNVFILALSSAESHFFQTLVWSVS